MRLFYVLTAMAALALVGSAPLFLRVLSSLPVHSRGRRRSDSGRA